MLIYGIIWGKTDNGVNKMDINQLLSIQAEKVEFSGVVLIKEGNNILVEKAFGQADRANNLSNTLNTRFGIASGCKLFTAIAICQLVEKGILSFETKLFDCLDIDFPHFDSEITIHHLLTHSSGIPDYFDEAVMDDFADLWKVTPMYTIKRLHDFLPLFQSQQMMFKPGEKFHYNNAGYIVLGLVIEQHTGVEFTEYIEKNVFRTANMTDSGYFELDQLPAHTAIGYIDKENGTWSTNIYSLPIKGGSDGGAFITAQDMMKLWDALFAHKLLSKSMTNTLLTPYICEADDEYYGYGIWITKREGEIFKYHLMGYDPGVSFHSSVYPNSGLKLVIPSNKEKGPYGITREIEKELSL